MPRENSVEPRFKVNKAPVTPLKEPRYSILSEINRLLEDSFCDPSEETKSIEMNSDDFQKLKEDLASKFLNQLSDFEYSIGSTAVPDIFSSYITSLYSTMHKDLVNAIRKVNQIEYNGVVLKEKP